MHMVYSVKLGFLVSTLIVVAAMVSSMTIAGTAPSIPADWVDGYNTGRLLFSGDAQSSIQFMPYVGNGYVATTIGTDDVFLNGVYKLDGLNEHRARIPSPINYSVNNATNIIMAMDTSSGIFFRRSTVGNVNIEERIYAHQVNRHLLVYELYLKGDGSITVSSNPSKDSTDIDFMSGRMPSGAAHKMGKVVTPIEPNSQTVVTVDIIVSATPTVAFTVTGGSDLQIVMLAAFCSTIDETDSSACASREFDNASASKESLMKSHIDAWNQIWKNGDIIVNVAPNDQKSLFLAQSTRSSLFYILQSLCPDWPHGISPGGLASNAYNGHQFWDFETWMYPPILMLNSSIAGGALDYRFQRLDAAKAKAQLNGYQGAEFPWESAETGREVCTDVEANFEIHINGDIILAYRQYFESTGNVEWLKSKYPLISAVSDFWTSRVNCTNNICNIFNVQPPDEYHWPKNNSIYTNYGAKLSLEFATKAAAIVGASPNPQWSTVAAAIPLIYDSVRKFHPEFDGYASDIVKQADVVLLAYPLGMVMSDADRRADLEWYANHTDSSGPAMTWSSFSINYRRINDEAKAAAMFVQGYANVRTPFGVWTETPTGGAINFITGAGGFLQSVIYGYGGVQLSQDSLTIENPMSPPSSAGMTLSGIDYKGASLSLQITPTGATLYVDSSAGQVTVSTTDTTGKISPPVVVAVGVSIPLPQGKDAKTVVTVK